MASDTKAAKRARSREKARARDDDGPLSVALNSGRVRHAVWLAVCGALGGFLLVMFGLIGQILGAVLVVVAAVHGWQFARTLLLTHRRIEIVDEVITLPSAACGGEAPEIALSDIKHAYFLRHAAPWAATGPLLVVETEAAVHAFPRHWFSSDTDQRKVATAINHHLDR